MPVHQTIAILGVGLIGGSIGKALRERTLADRVIGIGRNEDRLRMAEALGTIDEYATDLAAGVREAEVVVVCTPVGHIANHLLEAAQYAPKHALLTDAGSTKHSIVKAVEAGLRAAKPRAGSGEKSAGPLFIGSHPIAGSERSGCEAARGDLFVGRQTVITPTKKTPPEAVERAAQFWESLGSRVISMPPAEHDRIVASISHLPHVVAALLAAGTPEADLSFAGTGWRTATRIGAGDVGLWEQILLDNSAHVLKSLAKFEKVLAGFRRALESGNARALRKLLAQGKEHCERVNDSSAGQSDN